MTKKILMLLCFVLSLQQLYAQTKEFVWASQIGGTANDQVIKTKTDAEDNLYILGMYTGSTTIGSQTLTASSPTKTNYYLAKYTPDGTVTWAKSIENTSDNPGSFAINDIHVASTGAITLAGKYSRTLKLGSTTMTTSDKTNIYYARYSATGEFIWARSIGSDAGYEIANGIDLDAAGNIYLTGYLLGDIHLNQAATKHVYTAYVMKVSDVGSIVWVTENDHDAQTKQTIKEHVEYGGFDPDNYEYPQTFGNSIKVDPMGNIVVGGYFINNHLWGTHNVEGTFRTSGYDVFVVKLNSSGSPLWADAVRGGHYFGVNFTSLNIDKESNVYLAGNMYTDITYQNLSKLSKWEYTGVESTTYVLKINSTGAGLWLTDAGSDPANPEENYPQPYYNSPNSLTISPEGRIFLTGYLFGSPNVFGNTTLTSTTGHEDRYVAEISPAGNWLWAKQIPVNTNKDEGTTGTITSLKDGNVYVTGEFKSTIQLDSKTLTSKGGKDVFVSKMNVATTASLKIASLVLVNAETDKDITVIQDGAKYYLNQLPSKLTIRADTDPVKVGSVSFNLNGTLKVENIAPYAYAGDKNGDYNAMPALTAGQYTLTVTPYSGSNRSGTKGVEKVVRFEVLNAPTTTEKLTFMLIDAATDNDVMMIKQGDVITQLPVKHTIRVDVGYTNVKSVVMQLDARANKIENIAPYALAGDNSSTGDYYELSPGISTGMHTFTARAYSGSNGTGTLLEEKKITFEVQGSAVMASKESAKEEAVVAKAVLAAYPNPFSDKINIDITMAEAGKASLEVFDLQGRSVKQLFDDSLEAGTHNFTFNGLNLTNGVYITKLVAGGKVTHQRIILNR